MPRGDGTGPQGQGSGTGRGMGPRGGGRGRGGGYGAGPGGDCICPNCGETLETPNLRFCASCGSEIQATLTTETPPEPQVPVEQPPRATPTTAVSVYDTKPNKSKGSVPAKYRSKSCEMNVYPIKLK